MSKDALYFSHDSNAGRDTKIKAMRSVYGPAGYGWYWDIIEIFRECDGYKLEIKKYTYESIAPAMQSDKVALMKFIEDCVNEFELFKTDGKYLWSDSFLRRMEKMDKLYRQRKLAANSRWGKMRPQCDRNADAMQIKEKKRKESVCSLPFLENSERKKEFEELLQNWGSCVGVNNAFELPDRDWKSIAEFMNIRGFKWCMEAIKHNEKGTTARQCFYLKSKSEDGKEPEKTPEQKRAAIDREKLRQAALEKNRQENIAKVKSPEVQAAKKKFLENVKSKL